MFVSIFHGQSIVLELECSNPRFTEEFVRKCRFCVLMKAGITRKKINLPKSFFVIESLMLGQVPAANLNILSG